MDRYELKNHINWLKAVAKSPVPKVDARIVSDWLVNIRDYDITEAKKYTIEVFKFQGNGFLIAGSDGFGIGAKDTEDQDVQTSFTQNEIDAIKRAPNLAIDWDGVIIEPVEDKNENN